MAGFKFSRLHVQSGLLVAIDRDRFDSILARLLELLGQCDASRRVLDQDCRRREALGQHERSLAQLGARDVEWLFARDE